MKRIDNTHSEINETQQGLKASTELSQSIMLDFELADFYQIELQELKQAVYQNLKWFPKGFMFLLNGKEAKNMILKLGITQKNKLNGASMAFTEQGVAMLSAVLRSKKIVSPNVLWPFTS